MPFRKRAARRFKLAWPHVVGWRVGEIPAQGHALDDAAKIIAIKAFRHHKPHFARLRLAITGKLIGAQHKRKRTQSFVMRRICKAICSRWQEARQLSRPKTVHIGLAGTFKAEQDSGELAVDGGQQQQATGFGLESGGGNKPAFTLAKRPAHRIEVFTMDKPDRRRLRFTGACKNRMHVTPRSRANASIGGHIGYGKKTCANKDSLQVNQSLGLTFYCSGYAVHDTRRSSGCPSFRNSRPRRVRSGLLEWWTSRCEWFAWLGQRYDQPDRCPELLGGPRCALSR